MVAQRLFPRNDTPGNSWLKSWMVVAVLMLYQYSIASGGQPVWKSLLRGGNRSVVNFTKIDFLLNEIVPTTQTEKEVVQESFPWDDLRKVGAQRAALNYTPLSGFTVASGRARLESLRNKVEQRQQTHLDELHMPENIDYVVACNSCLDEVTSLELLKCPTWPQVPPVSHACIWYHSLTYRAYLCPCALCRPILQL